MPSASRKTVRQTDRPTDRRTDRPTDRRTDGQTDRPAALVTGGARRIGRALVERLAADGFDIAIHCHHSEADAIALCRDLRERHPGIDCGVFTADLSTLSDTAALIDAVGRSFPGLSVLVNNAAVYRRAPLADTDDALLDEAWRVNVRAPLVLAREFARFLGTKKGATGRIVNILDCRIAAPRPNEFAYEFSKRALAAATELLARELAPAVLVNAVAPGSVLAPDHAATAPSHQSLFRTAHTSSPAAAPDPAGTPLLGRHPTPEDVAEAVSSFARATMVTGQILYLDGGLRLSRP